MRSLNAAEPQFPGDDGAADPAVLAALAAYAASRGSEHAALNALASSRLLVPVVAALAEEVSGDIEAAGGPETARDSEATGGPEATEDNGAIEDSGADDAADVPGAGLRREKTTEMAMPTLIGQDGRAAVLAFTCLDSLTRWRPEARPVAVPAARAWQAGAEEASAVVIDVAGPVPVTVEGARLAALAAGRPAPLPHQDPDVLAALHTALGNEPLIVQAALTTPDQQAGWEYGPRPEDLPDLAARSGADLSALGLDLPAPASPGQNGTRPAGAGQNRAGQNGASQNGAGRGTVGRDSAADDRAAGTSAAEPGDTGTSASKPSAVGTSASATGEASAGGSAGVGSAAQDRAGRDRAAPGRAGRDSAGRDSAAQDSAAHDSAAQDSAGQDTADLALQVTLADGCDPAAATAAVRRVAEALLTATRGRLRRGMEVSVTPPRRAPRAR